MATLIKGYTLSQCMAAMADYAASREAEGEYNLIFCEDRLTLLAEQALVKRMGGSFLSSVSTFARFVDTEEKILSKQGSVMTVGEVMTNLQRENKLQCFTTAQGIGNNARCIYETLAQMSASEVTPDVLKESLVLLPEDTLKRKVSDLALIYERYQAFLKEGAIGFAVFQRRHPVAVLAKYRAKIVVRGKSADDGDVLDGEVVLDQQLFCAVNTVRV